MQVYWPRGSSFLNTFHQTQQFSNNPYSIMKKFQDSYNYISHLRRLASIMNSSARDSFHCSPHKTLSERKTKQKARQRLGQRENKWREYKENVRIAESIINKPGVVNFQSTEEDFRRHLRIRKLRTMFPARRHKHKQVVIKDVMWKNEARVRDEVLEIKGCEGETTKMARDQLKDKVISLDMGQTIELSISGDSKRGKMVIKDSSIVPIVHKGKGVGTAIVSIIYR